MHQKSDYIAVLDSGVGGISVLRQLRKLMPGENYIYFGDSAHAPYGTKPAAQVRQLTLSAVEKLMDYGIKALVVACNTATAVTIEELRQKFPDTIIVGIEPALKLAAQAHPGGTVGVLATPVTLEGEKFQRLSHRFDENCRVIPIPAPGLAELVEEGNANSPQAQALLEAALAPHAHQLDALVLGCTHYPFAAATIRNIVVVPLYDGGEGTARETRRRLAQKDLLQEGEGTVLIQNSLPGEEMRTRCARLLTQPQEDWL